MFYSLFSEARNVVSKIRLSDYFTKPQIVQNQNNYDSFTRGLLTQNSQAQDEFFTEEVEYFYLIYLIYKTILMKKINK